MIYDDHLGLQIPRLGSHAKPKWPKRRGSWSHLLFNRFRSRHGIWWYRIGLHDPSFSLLIGVSKGPMREALLNGNAAKVCPYEDIRRVHWCPLFPMEWTNLAKGKQKKSSFLVGKARPKSHISSHGPEVSKPFKPSEFEAELGVWYLIEVSLYKVCDILPYPSKLLDSCWFELIRRVHFVETVWAWNSVNMLCLQQQEGINKSLFFRNKCESTRCGYGPRTCYFGKLVCNNWYLMSSGSEMADSELVPYGVLCFLNLEVDKANPESSFRWNSETLVCPCMSSNSPPELHLI